MCFQRVPAFRGRFGQRGADGAQQSVKPKYVFWECQKKPPLGGQKSVKYKFFFWRGPGRVVKWVLKAIVWLANPSNLVKKVSHSPAFLVWPSCDFAGAKPLASHSGPLASAENSLGPWGVELLSAYCHWKLGECGFPYRCDQLNGIAIGPNCSIDLGRAPLSSESLHTSSKQGMIFGQRKKILPKKRVWWKRSA